ncbi:hypothetical protein H2200_010767 [Cladophialophora chaetospira]|uniref:Uncharacterized protein n=1 Tax=Cladophialophora chaetospira TaxID=386627 RepID=A0AA38X0Q1_9EURO|nr:hypothetical protein H2200_010767 [Cladophialophora chaetospira]
MPSEPGHKRRLVLQWLGGLLRVPTDPPVTSGSIEHTVNSHSTLATAPNQPPSGLSTVLERKFSPTDEPSSASSEEPPQLARQLPPTVPQPVAWLKGVDLDQLWDNVNDCYVGVGRETSVANITIFGDEPSDRIWPFHAKAHSSTGEAPPGAAQLARDDNTISEDSSSSDSEAPGNKGFSPLFDTGARVNVIPLKTLRRLKKGYVKLSSLHADQQDQMGLRGLTDQRVTALGLVALIWYLDTFPSAIFNTTFFVVDDNSAGEHDLIIARTFSNAVAVAIKEERKVRNMGPVKRFLKDTRRHTSVAMLRQVSTRTLRSGPHPEEAQNLAGPQVAAGQFKTGR